MSFDREKLKKMNPKERVLKTFRHEEPDRVPIFEQLINAKIVSEILGKESLELGAGGFFGFEEAKAYFEGREEEFKERMRETLKVYDILEMDIVQLPYQMKRKPTKKIDENTFYYEDKESSTWSIYRYFPKTSVFGLVDSSLRKEGISEIEKIVKIGEKAQKEKRNFWKDYQDLDYLVEKYGKEKAVVVAAGGCVSIPLEPAWLEALIQRPDLVERSLELQLVGKLQYIETQVEHGVDFIWGGHDLCDKNGPVYSPFHFRKFILPRLKKITDLCHKLGVPYLYRTDGNIWPVAQELFVESGVDAYGEIDKSAGMDLGELKTKLPHLTLWGNVDCGETLINGTKQEIIAETIDCLRKGAPGGGYILGSSNSIQAGVSAESFLLMLDTVKKYGRYPVKL